MSGERLARRGVLTRLTMHPQTTDDDDVGEGHDSYWKEEHNNGDEGVVDLARRGVEEVAVDCGNVRLSRVRLH